MKKTLLTVFAALMAVSTFGQQMTDTETHSKYILAVDEYVPAPGQFVNVQPKYEEGDDAATMANKCTALVANNKGQYVTLGAFGGYITFHFDHSIANVKGQRDLYLKGNAFVNNAEPGVVMVSKDVNRNGIADDAWYEIAGSADRDSLANMIFGYEVTYRYDSLKDVPWTDNKGFSGLVNRNNFHKQEYYPLWLKDNLTLKGTLLRSNQPDANGKTPAVSLKSYDYGYVDNKPNTDTTACSVDFDWAVDPITRDTVAIDFVDFVRVYNGLQQMAGAIGETSTEFVGAEDLHLEASLEAIRQANSTVATFEELALNEDSVLNMKQEGEDMVSSAFVSAGFKFNYNYNANWDSWSGYAVSGRTDTTYVSYVLGQYNSCVGHGYGGSANYLVAYPQGETIEVADENTGARILKGMYVAVNTYVQNAIVNGDIYSGAAFTTGDYFTLNIVGLDADGEPTDTLTYALADYRSADATAHSYAKDWSYVDLTALGEVSALKFFMDGSRKGQWGLDTPAYFLMDNFNDEYDGTSAKLAIFEPLQTTGITRTEVGTDATIEGIYTVDGKRVSTPVKGLNIVKYTDGRVVKIMK
jgi:hypothetical protein